MNKKIGILAILALGIVLIGTIAYYLLVYTKNNVSKEAPVLPDSPGAPAQTETKPVSDNKNPLAQTPVSPERPVASADLERIAKSFAERFGSFSNQSNFSNITDLEIFMSQKMKSWSDNYIKKNQKANVADEVYYGLTTKAVSAKTESFDEGAGTAKIIVSTRRREAMGTTNNASKLYNQDVAISFVKEAQVWKVDSAIWINN
jgi:hypothetical protein